MGDCMTAVIVLVALSALVGFALGTSFSWLAIAASSIGIAVLSSAILQIQGFGVLPGIAIVVACLAVNQMAYLAGALGRSSGLFQKPADDEPGQRRNKNVAGKRHQQQKAPS
jgi:hypothetical protein